MSPVTREDVTLDWANERYVRIYVRETPDQALWCWQARALWPWLIIRADRSGEIRTRHGAAGIAQLVRLPLDLVTEALTASDGLLADGCIVETAYGFALRNYVEAQTAPLSTSQRKANQRARARLAGVIFSDLPDKPDKPDAVTKRHAKSREVTSVTKCHPEPSRADREEDQASLAFSITPQPSTDSHTVEIPGYSREELAACSRVLAKIGERTGVTYRLAKAHVKLIVRQLHEGVTERELRGVALYCWFELNWQDKPEMHRYYRPETLFGPESIHKYLPAARAYLAKHYPDD